MLSVSNVRLVIFAKHPAWRSLTGDTYCHLRTRRSNYQRLVQAVGYSAKCNAKKINDTIDPRVEALRDKLIYCDHLDYQKTKTSNLERFLTVKKAESYNMKIRMDKLRNVPVYSVLLDAHAKDDESISQPDSPLLEKLHDSSDASATRPVHMPYASTDQYSNVDVPANNPHERYVEIDEKIPLNKRYKVLYDKYLAAKNAISDKREDLSLEEYLEEQDSGVMSKTDVSNVPDKWIMDFEQYDDTLQDSTWLSNYGTPDPTSSVSDIPCGGCGALLHCKDHAIPGYLPSELFLQRKKEELRIMICQRCHFMKYYNAMLEVKVSADEYPELLQVIRKKKCAVILMVDLLDFPCSIWPEINSVLNPRTSVFVVGNKIDLLPQDSRYFFDHVKKCLSRAILDVGVCAKNIRHVALISAKTGYGVEQLINKLHNLWGYKGDVYVIGCTNVGKSSLFNALLQSDYCKVQAVDLIQRATTSPWPGTTLNLLKFPILNPVRWRLYWRMMRLRAETQDELYEEKLRINQFQVTRNLNYATLQSRIGRTFLPKSKIEQSDDQFAETKYKPQKFGFDENKEEYKLSRWCYDTPGTIQPDQILDLLTTEELLKVLPKKIISPRTFLLRSNQTIFLAGLGRLDYVEGENYIRCTIFSSNELPVTVTHTADADSVYNELLKTKALAVPENNPDRLKHWPMLGFKEMEVTGIGYKESVADVVLSSAGWIAITGEIGQRILLRAWNPQGRGLYLRTPALLKKSVTLRGSRVLNAPMYRSGRQAYRR